MHPNELTTELLQYAYRLGAFPMTMEDESIEWFQPRMRALFPIEGLHVSSSMKKVLRQRSFEIRFDTQFEAVMRNCLRPSDNWISEPLIQVYTEAHREGWAHCAECWQGGELVGGVYGLAIGGCFFAESMFHRTTNASKVALWAMIEKCRELGFVLFDAQIMNPHLRSLGAFEIHHMHYMALLGEALNVTTAWGSRQTGEPFRLREASAQ